MGWLKNKGDNFVFTSLNTDLRLTYLKRIFVIYDKANTSSKKHN